MDSEATVIIEDTVTIKIDVPKKKLAAALFVANVAVLTCLALTVLIGCGHAETELSKQLGCTLAGNGCEGRGEQGLQGAVGATGPAGNDGIGCSVVSVAPGPLAPYGGALVQCGAIYSILTNGAPGAVGPQGDVGPAAPPSTYQVVKMVTACPAQAGNFREVMLVLANHTILSSFSDSADGQNTRLALIAPGSYVSTDGRNCAFTVGADTISWSGGSASY